MRAGTTEALRACVIGAERPEEGFYTISSKSRFALEQFLMRKDLRMTATVIALMSAIAVAGCNTVQGMGQDVQAGGNAVSSAAAETQTSMQNGAAPSDTGYVGENMAGEARIDMASARARALGERPGNVTSQSLQRRDGGSGLRYSFNIRSDNVSYEVGVDAGSGAILQNRRIG